MKTNVSIELNEHELRHVANLLDRKVTARKATRREIGSLLNAAMRRILDLNLEDVQAAYRASDPELELGSTPSENLLRDIDRGGWSFIDEPLSWD